MNPWVLIATLVLLFNTSCSSNVDANGPNNTTPSIDVGPAIGNDGESITITGSGFLTHPTLDRIQFLGGFNGWQHQKQTGDYLKTDLGPEIHDIGEGGFFSHTYTSGYGDDDRIDNTVLRGPGDKNSILLQTGLNAPSGSYTSSWGFHSDEVFDKLYFTAYHHYKVDDVEIALNGEGEVVIPQYKFLTVAPGETGDTIGSARNHFVVGNLFKENPAEGIAHGGVEVYSWQGYGPVNATYYNGCESTIYSAGIAFAPPTQPIGYELETCDFWNLLKFGGGGTELASFAPEPEVWNKFELYIEAGEFDEYDGRFRFAWLKPNLGWKVGMDFINVALTSQVYGDSGDNTLWKRALFYAYAGQDSEGGGETKINMQSWLDDVYIQIGTPARVEIGDADRRENCKRIEIQRPTAWSDTAITFELNWGGFQEGDQAYIFVINDQEEISQGIPITVGETLSNE